MLLHIEEIQMQKDIRNYDMKGVEFDQDGTDRSFLILEVSENFASSIFFFFASSMKTTCSSSLRPGTKGFTWRKWIIG